MSNKMKRTVLLLLVGCLVISPVSFAGEQIQLAAAIGAGPSNGGPKDDDDNRGAGYIPPGSESGSGLSKEVVTKTVVATLGGLVALAVLAVSGGKTSSSSSH